MKWIINLEYIHIYIYITPFSRSLISPKRMAAPSTNTEVPAAVHERETLIERHYYYYYLSKKGEMRLNYYRSHLFLWYLCISWAADPACSRDVYYYYVHGHATTVVLRILIWPAPPDPIAQWFYIAFSEPSTHSSHVVIFKLVGFGSASFYINFARAYISQPGRQPMEYAMPPNKTIMSIYYYYSARTKT